MHDLLSRARNIRLLVLDVDGVLTDGGLFYGPAGEVLKRFNVKDGQGLVMAREVGLPTVLMTARSSPMVETRARELGLADVLQSQSSKLPALKRLLERFQVPAEACAYMGDDVKDLGPLGHVGLPACPSDAVAEVRQTAQFISRFAGGQGAVRELVELCLRASGRWDAALAKCAGDANDD